MNIIDKLGQVVLSFFGIFRDFNKTRNVELFLFKRNLNIIKFNNRIFIILDQAGETFIKDCLMNNFSAYTINKSKLDNFIGRKYQPGNEFISQVWYNDLFKFEFIKPEHYHHLLYSCNLAEKYDIQIGLDSIFVHSVHSINNFRSPENFNIIEKK